MEYIQTLHGHIKKSLMDKLSKVDLIVFDVDGTLTDGGIYFDNNGTELKRFYAQDGLGIALLSKFNITSAIITGRQSKLVERRAQELKISYVKQGCSSKDQALQEIKQQAQLQNLCLCMGDDLNDLPMFELADIKVSPQDANAYIKSISDLVLNSKAGYGAAREICDLILIAKGYMTQNGNLTNINHFKINRQ